MGHTNRSHPIEKILHWAALNSRIYTYTYTNIHKNTLYMCMYMYISTYLYILMSNVYRPLYTLDINIYKYVLIKTHCICVCICISVHIYIYWCLMCIYWCLMCTYLYILMSNVYRPQQQKRSQQLQVAAARIDQRGGSWTHQPPPINPHPIQTTHTTQSESYYTWHDYVATAHLRDHYICSQYKSGISTHVATCI